MKGENKMSMYSPMSRMAQAVASGFIINNNQGDQRLLTRSQNFRASQEERFLLAAQQGKTNEVYLLLRDTGLNRNVQNEEGCTALHLAIVNRHTELVDFLITHGVDVNLQDEGGFTALHLAIIHGPIELVNFLILYRADVNLSNRFGITPLHLATQLNRLGCIDLLIRKGADLNPKSIHGATPLDHLTLQQTYSNIPEDTKNLKETISKFLISKGAERYKDFKQHKVNLAL